MDTEQIKCFLRDSDFGSVDSHRAAGGVVETCSWGPCYTSRQTKILKELQTKIAQQQQKSSADMSLASQKESTLLRYNMMLMSKAAIAKKKKKRRPSAVAAKKTDAELKRELAELKKLARAHIRAAKATTKQAIALLDKMGDLEAATERLDAALAVKARKKAS